MWSLNRGGVFIGVVARAGLTVIMYTIHSVSLLYTPHLVQAGIVYFDKEKRPNQ